MTAGVSGAALHRKTPSHLGPLCGSAWVHLAKRCLHSHRVTDESPLRHTGDTDAVQTMHGGCLDDTAPSAGEAGQLAGGGRLQSFWDYAKRLHIFDNEVQTMRRPLCRATVAGSEVSMARKAHISEKW